MNSNLIELKQVDFMEAMYDIDFSLVHAWKQKNPGKKAIATFPVYVPHELIHAMGHLPVTIFGGGEEVSISHADAILGSFICSISKSTTELMLSNDRFNSAFDGFVFPFICDVARNLSGIFERRSDKPSYMLHLSQNVESKASVKYLANEYQRMLKTLFPEETLDLEKLKESIKLYNDNRRLYRKILKLRTERPMDVPLRDWYTIMRMGSQLPVELENKLLEEAYEKFRNNSNLARDAIRVVITGNFCEQPPLDVIDLIEQVGCYVIDDEFMIGRRYIKSEIEINNNPIETLADDYIHKGTKLASRFHEGEKGANILDRVRQAKADGVLFLTAKFCEPALDDLVLQQHALYENNIPYVHVEFEERGSGYENIRLSLETFVESQLFD